MLTLDDEQRRAVDAGPTDVFISAGAGSGKTRVLTARFVRAVLGAHPYPPCDPGSLLTVTFTEKAAGELADRIRRELASAGLAGEARRIGDAWITTIHGMCARILHQYAFEAELDPEFSVLDDVESSALEVAALEEIVTALLGSDAGATALIDAYGFAAIARATRDARADALAVGLGVDAITTLDPSDMRRAIESARESFADIAAGFRELRRLKTVERNEAAARAAQALIDQALVSSTVELDALVVSLNDVGFRRCGSVDGNDVLADDANALLEDVRLALAQLAVTPYEQSFLRILRAFDQRLQALKVERGLLDFQDLQLVTARLLEARPDIAAGLRDRFAMLMVDEFQDTDELQLVIAERLARGNLCTVGDEHQSIYAFRSADIEVFRRRAADAGQSVRLRTNYRTAPDLLASLNGLFAAGALFGDDHTELIAPTDPAQRGPWPEGRPRFEVRFCDSTDFGDLDAKRAEAECIAQRVVELVESGVRPGDIAVLLGAVRGGHGDALQAALERYGIPVFLAAGGDYFECAEVTEARALLRVIDNVRDDAALVTVLRGRMTALTDDGMCLLRAAADVNAGPGFRRDGRLWAVIAPLSEAVELDPADRAVLERTVDAIMWARAQRGLRPIGEIVHQVLLRLDMDLVLLATGPSGRRAWANLMKLVQFADEYESVAGGDLGGLLDYLAVRETHAASEREAVLEVEATAVRVMSIHSAKGLEFPVVVVGGLDHGSDSGGIGVRRIDGVPLLGMRLPVEDTSVPTAASERVGAARAATRAEEAVRLLYVACTRAREALTLVARTNPLKEADSSLGGRVRSALGLAGAGSIAEESWSAPAHARVQLVRIAGAALPSEVIESMACEAPEPLPPVKPVGTSVFGAPRIVSYTGLSRYATCPYSFYAATVARMPSPPAQGGPDARAFGIAVHRVLEHCTSREPLPVGTLEAAAAAAGLDESEMPRLRAAIGTFLDSDLSAELFSAARVLREAPVAVPVGGVVLAGAVDVIAFGEGDVLIADFKTGRGATTPAEALERYRLQATCYGLAALATGARSARVVFIELEIGRETAYRFVAADRPDLEATIGALTDRMHAGDYAPRGTYEPSSCESCPAFGSLCPVLRP